MPSLFVSAAEKFGDVALLLDAPPAADGREEDEEDEDGLLDGDPVELLPDTDGEDEDGLVLDEDEDCATARDDSANNTAAVVMLRVLGMKPPVVVETAHNPVQTPCQWISSSVPESTPPL